MGIPEESMGKVIAVFNTKGGVGKSTTVMMLAEALSEFSNKRILVIDADPQTSVSVMMTPKHDGVPNHLKEKCWDWAERNKSTVVHFFAAACHETTPPPIDQYCIGAVSDVEGARTIDLMPGHMELALFEIEMVEVGGRDKLDRAVQGLLKKARSAYDIVFIDCPPGVTSLTMYWLEHADYFLPPTTPNYLGIRGLAVTTRLRERFNRERRHFAPSAGTLITLDSDTRAERLAKQEIVARDKAAGLVPFPKQIPRLATIQRSSEYAIEMRSFAAKYPSTPKHDVPRIIKDLANEVAKRIT
jgi:chromosome partitioning protein